MEIDYDYWLYGPNKIFQKLAFTFVTQYFRYTLVAVNQTLVEKYGMHEAAFYQLINDKVRKRIMDA